MAFLPSRRRCAAKRLGLGLGAAAALTLCALGQAAHGVQDVRHARAGDISLTVNLLSKDGAITAYEPLLARVTLKNESQEPVEVTMSGDLTMRLEVRDAKGKVVAATRRQQFPVDFFAFPWRPKPGETRSTILIVTMLYQFETPGKYTVTVQQLDARPELPLLAEGTAGLTVLPFDASRLDARCNAVFEPLRKHSSSKTDLTMEARVKALYSVRHDIALPYLDWIVRQSAAKYGVRAMRRIRTERAERLIEALAARKDRVGEATRQATEMPLEPYPSEVETLWVSP